MSMHALMYEVAARCNADVSDNENVLALQVVQEDGMVLSLEYVRPVDQLWIQGMLLFFPGDSLLEAALTYALASNAYLHKTRGAFYTCSTATSQVILQKRIAAEGKDAAAIGAEIAAFAELLTQCRDDCGTYLKTFGQPAKMEKYFDCNNALLV